MNYFEQLKYIESHYPATTHHISKRHIRHEFFQNMCVEIQLYLLGFYVADGSIDQKRKTFRVTVSEKDSEIIDLYKTFISSEARIFKVKGHVIAGRNGELYQQNNFIGIDITSQTLTQSLVNLGYGYKKTFSNMQLPKTSDELTWSFIRGLFDGDGCFTVWYVAPQNGRKERIRGKFDIVQKTDTLLLDIQQFLLKFDIESKITFLQRDNMYRLSIGSTTTLKKLYTYLYNDANFYLTRKFKKFNHYVNTEVTQLIDEYRNAQKVNVNESNNPSTSAGHPNNQDENIC